MMHNHRPKIFFARGIWLVYAGALLFLPLEWIFGWGIAVFVHEASHYIALVLLKCNIHSVYIGYGGVRMQTGPLSPKEEILCAIAGPVGGLLPMLIIRRLPSAGVSAMILSLYNLLPFYPMDGGRVMRTFLKISVKEKYFKRIMLYIQWIPFVLLLGSSMLLNDIRICALMLPIAFHALQAGREKDLAKRDD